MNWFEPTKEYYGKNWFKSMELAYPQLFRHFQSNAISATLVKPKINHNQVAVIISGGGADGPLLPGFVGEGLADACVVGAPYSAPNAYSLYEIGKELGEKKGCLLLFNNFMGDYLNNDMAAELLRIENYSVEVIPVHDDMGTAIDEPRENRGGRCALPFLIKLAAGAASEGKTLEEIASLVKKANHRTSTISVLINTENNTASFGDGFSGEPGFLIQDNTTPQKVAEKAAKLLLADVRPSKQEKIFLLINRLKLTSYSDSYVMAGFLHKAIALNYPIAQLRVGAYFNVLDSYGYTFTALCADDEITSYLEGLVHGDSFSI